MDHLKGKTITSTKEYLREFCEKCFKKTRMYINTKIVDEKKTEYSVQCDECKSHYLFVKE